MLTLWQIMIAFGRANLLGYGGGPAVIPLVKNEIVDTFHWLTAEEFADALAIGNSLPGPIATKMSAYIGYKVAGYAGAVVALVGTVLPTALIMIALAAFLMRFKDSPILKGMIKGVKPVVFVLFVLLAIEYLPFARPDKAGWLPFAIGAAAFVAIYFLKINQAFAILGAIILGGILIR